MIKIYDLHGNELVSWAKGQYNGYTHTKEDPGGMISCAFNVPEEYTLPFRWADVFSTVKVWHEANLIFQGFIFALERYWDKDNSGIKVDCVGEVARLNWAYTVSDLSAEKTSTYINAHILPHAQVYGYIKTGKVSTDDYTIPGVVEAGECALLRDMLDRAYAYNANAFTWYVDGDSFYFVPSDTQLTYQTSIKYCTGSLRQDLADFANALAYTYRDLAGLATLALLADSDTVYPTKYRRESFENNMTAAQALQQATESLNNSKVLGSVGTIKINRVWRFGKGEIHRSELEPGKIIRILGLTPGKVNPEAAFVANDVDAFTIKSVTYNEDDQSADIAAGRLPQTLTNVVRAR